MNRILLIPLSTLLILSGCSTALQPGAPVTHHGQSKGGGSAGMHRIVPGDTLWSISNRYNIALQDIASANKMRAPFVLNSGERITLPPPREYVVKPGDSISAISRIFSVSPSQVASQNDISAPYTLRVGQKLRLPSASRSELKKLKIAKHSAHAPAPTTKPHAPHAKTTTTHTHSKTSKTPARSKIASQTPKRSSNTFLKPINGRTISSYGPKKNSLHNDGINIAAPRGTPVKAAENGVVVYAGSELKGSGNLVLIRHDDRWMTAYGHLDKISIKRGDVLKRGEALGTVGSTGSVDRPQLHFEVRRGTTALNPEKYLEG